MRDTCPGSPTPSRRPGSQVRLMNTDGAPGGGSAPVNVWRITERS